jgi:hypothetical protein
MSVFQVGGGTAGAPTITELQSKGILSLSLSLIVLSLLAYQTLF